MKSKYNPLTGSLPFSPELIKRRIFIVRGQQVMLDSDLADLYMIETRTLIQLRKMMIEHQALSERLQKAEKMIGLHDQVLIAVVEDVKKFKNPQKINAIGFQWKPKTKI